MSFIQYLLDLLASLSSQDTHRSRERTTITGGNQEIEIALYQSKALTEKNGHVPEQTIAKFFQQALDDVGVGYKIDYGYEETYDPIVKRDGTNLETFKWWVDNSPERADDCNMLLYDNRGGGRAGLGGPNSIRGARRIREFTSPQPSCDSSTCHSVWGALHELGHNLGGKHSTPMLVGKPSMYFHDNMKKHIKERYDNLTTDNTSNST